MNNMNMHLIILLLHIDAVSLIHITASYTTPFKCSDGSYALISGTNLTIEYNYGHSRSELQSFHLYEKSSGRKMFDYESGVGKAFIKDRKDRLKSYEWTKTGIKLTISYINKDTDFGKYEGYATIENQTSTEVIEITNIFDPPSEVKITTPSDVEEILILNKGFREKTIEVSAESNATINCSGVSITWSPTKGKPQSCQAEDEKDATFCPFTLKESQMVAGECFKLDVYAEQYGVRSETKTYALCYSSTNEHVNLGTKEHVNSVCESKASIGMKTGVLIGVLAGASAVIIVIAIVVLLKRRGCNKENGAGQFTQGSVDDEAGTQPHSELVNM